MPAIFPSLILLVLTPKLQQPILLYLASDSVVVSTVILNAHISPTKLVLCDDCREN